MSYFQDKYVRPDQGAARDVSGADLREVVLREENQFQMNYLCGMVTPGVLNQLGQ